jgi:hypothetical protein
MSLGADSGPLDDMELLTRKPAPVRTNHQSIVSFGTSRSLNDRWSISWRIGLSSIDAIPGMGTFRSSQTRQKINLL